MRKVNYGRFVDFMPPEPDYDSGLIGGHIYQRNAEQASLKTAGYEYYITEDGSKVTIYDASLLEKLSARIKFVFKPKKKRVLGVRTERQNDINPYSSTVPQLGVKYDKAGNLVVDEDYYNAAEERALLRGDRASAQEAHRKKLETEAELAKMFEDTEEKSIDDNKFVK